jgi:hypothetical protein
MLNKNIIFLITIAFCIFGLYPSLINAQEKKTQTNETVNKEVQPDWDPNLAKKDTERVETPLKAAKQYKETDFLVFGATVGSPAGFNLMAGYYWKDLVIRGSGGYWSKEWWGGQVDLGYSFFKTPVIAHSISVSIGSYGVNPYRPEPGRGGQSILPGATDFPGYAHRPASFEDNIIRSYVASYDANLSTYLEYRSRETQNFYFTQRYVGMTYDVLLGNFFVQLGAGSGSGDFRNPVLLMQFGYLFDFRSEKK